MMTRSNARIRLAAIRLAAVLLTAAACAGCLSTEKRFDRAKALEAQGRFAEAADYYIQVLDREPDWTAARGRLETTGQLAVDDYLEQAAAYRSTQSFKEALDVLDRLDALRSGAEGVGVILTVPEDYASYRREINEAAITEAIAAAEEAEASGLWTTALQRYEAIERRFDLDPQQARVMQQARGRVYLKWAEQDLARETFRDAYEHAGRAAELFDPESTQALQARDLQDSALAAGTHFVAFLPFWRRDGVGEATPRGLLDELNDVLLYEYWSAPVLFVETIDPGEVRRELRRLRYDRKLVTRREASEIGHALEADFVVVGELAEFEAREENVREERQSVRTRGRNGRDTTFVERSYRLEYEADVAFQLVDPQSRRVVDEGTVQASAADDFRRGVYEGDYRDLDLSRSQRDLFDEETLRQAERALEDELLGALGERIAERVFGDLVERIP